MSFGSAFGAIVSLKNNRRKNSGRTEKYISGNESISGIKSHRTPSAEELEQIRDKLKKKNKIQQRKTIFISAIFLFLVSLFFIFYMI